MAPCLKSSAISVVFSGSLNLSTNAEPIRPFAIDAKGRIRYHHFGEGEYVKSERVIQALLRENGATGLDESTVRIAADGAEAPPEEDGRSPETYVGYPQPVNFKSP